MANPFRYVYNSTQPKFVLGGQDVLAMDWPLVPFLSSILVDLVSGSITYAVEFTNDDIVTGNPLTWRWMPLPGFPYGTTATQALGNPPNPNQWTLNFPVTALRLNIQALSGTVNFSVIQGHRV